jgi:hypothetical protein
MCEHHEALPDRYKEACACHAAALSTVMTVCESAVTRAALTGRAVDKLTTNQAARAALSAGVLEHLVAVLVHPSTQKRSANQKVFVTGAVKYLAFLGKRLGKFKVRYTFY